MKRTVASIVLALEACVVFFVTLVFFGLKIVSPGVAFGGGAALFLLFIVAAGLLRYRVGYWLGWALQVVFIALGFLEPTMFVVGGIFAAMWVFGIVRGSSVDRLNAEHSAAQESE
jgi:hypothetical protein